MTKKYVYQQVHFSRRSLAEAVDLAKHLNIPLNEIDIISFEEYGWDYSERVSGLEYKRLESDEEYAKRLETEKAQQEAREKRELAEYERLSKKYK